MAFGFFRKKKPTKAQASDPEPVLILDGIEVYKLLRKIDGGYRPTAAERRALAERKFLDLRGAPITALPKSLGQLAKLQILFLGNTRITALPESLGQLAQLRELYLNRTQITALPESLGQLANLKYLYLDYTPITALPDWLGELPELGELDLRGLTLPRLPRSLALRGLPFVDRENYGYTGVNLHGVTLTEQDKAVFLQNDRALIEALYEKEQLRLPECRVIFLGDGDSGKSYTIRRFQNGGRRETAAAPY